MNSNLDENISITDEDREAGEEWMAELTAKRTPDLPSLDVGQLFSLEGSFDHCHQTGTTEYAVHAVRSDGEMLSVKQIFSVPGTGPAGSKRVFSRSYLGELWRQGCLEVTG